MFFSLPWALQVGDAVASIQTCPSFGAGSAPWGYRGFRRLRCPAGAWAVALCAALPHVFPLSSPLHRAEGNQVAISGICFIPAPFWTLFRHGLSESSRSAPTLLLSGSSIPLAPSSLRQLPPAGTRLLDPPGCWVQVVGTHGWVPAAPWALPRSGSPGTPTCGSRAARPEPPCATSLFN